MSTSQQAVSEGLFLLNELIDMGDMSQRAVILWQTTLRKYSPEEITYGFATFMENRKSSDFGKPLPGDIKKIIEDAKPTSSWAEAFQWLQENIHMYQPMPKFPNELTRRAFEAFGGKNAIVNMLTADMKTHNAQFRGIYEDLARKEIIHNDIQLNAGVSAPQIGGR